MSRARYVLLSSKGQLVIPAVLRRRLNLNAGQRLAVRANGQRGLLLEPVEDGRNLDGDLARARACVARAGRDLVDELHRRRERERAHLEREHGPRRH